MVQKLVVGRIDLGGFLKGTNGMVRRLKTQIGRNSINLALDQSAHHPDSNGVNATQIRSHMKKLE